MDRGLKIVTAGLVPVFSLFALSWVADVSDANARVLVPVAFLVTGMLFLAGTTVIITDKGHSLLIGLALGMMAPLGTMIALILEDKRRPESGNCVDAVVERSVDNAALDDATESFGAMRKLITRIAALVAVVYALTHFGIYADYMLKFKGGVPTAKVFIAAVQGLISGLTVWGAAVMFTVTVAPQQWLLKSGDGKKWMARTGLKAQSSTIPLRVMTAVIGLVAGAWIVLSVNILVAALTSQK